MQCDTNASNTVECPNPNYQFGFQTENFSSVVKLFEFRKRPKSEQNRLDFGRSNDQLNPSSNIWFSEDSARLGHFIYNFFLYI